MTNPNERKRHAHFTRVRGTLLKCDGVPDSTKELIEFSGVEVGKEKKIRVVRGFTETAGFVLGIADVHIVDTEGGKDIELEFNLPTKPLPPFPLYFALGGVKLESHKREDGVTVITKCRIDVATLSTDKNVDLRIEPIREVTTKDELADLAEAVDDSLTDKK